MKVLIASDFFAPTINGVVTSILNLQYELERHGHEVRVLTLRQKESYGYDDCVYVIPSFSAGKFYPGARIMRTMATEEVREIREWHPDIIHTNNEFSTFLLAQMMATRLDIPIVHTYHTVYEDYIHYFSPNEALGRGLVRRFSKNLLERTDAVIVPTEKVREILTRYEVNTPVYTVPTGIDLQRFMIGNDPEARSRLRSQYGIGEDEFILLSLGRLAKEKNIEELIGYLRELPPRVRMVIVGGGPYQEVLKTSAASMGLKDRVIFTGMVRPEEVPAYYQIADAFVSGSTSETQGLTYIEALACGLPSICRRDGAIEGIIINDVNGWQYETQAEYTRAVETLVNDPALCKGMSQAALETARRYSTEVFYENMIKVYEEVISGPRKHRAPLPHRIRRRLYKPGDFNLEGLRRKYFIRQDRDEDQ